MMTVMINNLPETLKHRWIVCLVSDGELWFYNAWADNMEGYARAQAREVAGIVVDNTSWMES